MIFLICRTNCR